MYEKRTGDITIAVEPVYLTDQSEPEKEHYLWAYHVQIKNEGSDSVCLKERFWQITDGLGQVTEVSGEGVVGEQPVISAGDTFEYTSGTPLSTPSGIMVGQYFLETEDGKSVVADIPAFSLDSPFHQTQLH